MSHQNKNNQFFFSLSFFLEPQIPQSQKGMHQQSKRSSKLPPSLKFICLTTQIYANSYSKDNLNGIHTFQKAKTHIKVRKGSNLEACLRIKIQYHQASQIKAQLLFIVQISLALNKHRYQSGKDQQLQFGIIINRRNPKLSNNALHYWFSQIIKVLEFRIYFNNFFFYMKPKIIAISGALEEESPISNLLKKCTILASNLTIELVSIKEVPLLNIDLFNGKFPPSIQTIRQKVYESEGLIFAVPEFFGKVSPAFKNIFDWLSWSPNAEHPAPIRGMPACMISVGGQEGSSIHKHLLQMSHFCRVQIMSKPTFHISKERIDNFKNLQSISPQDNQDLKTFLQYFSQFVNKKSKAQ